MNVLIRCACLGVWLLAWAAPAWAADAVFVDGGLSDTPSGWLLQGGARWDWGWHMALSDSLHLGGAWQLGLAYGHWRETTESSDDSIDVNITPILRLQWRQGMTLEGGVGAHLLGNFPKNRVSSAFQFGSLVGVGYPLIRDVMLGIRFQHLSNAGINAPNGGINMYLLHIEYNY